MKTTNGNGTDCYEFAYGLWSYCTHITERPELLLKRWFRYTTPDYLTESEKKGWQRGVMYFEHSPEKIEDYKKLTSNLLNYVELYQSEII
jgi:hypothetical protein